MHPRGAGVFAWCFEEFARSAGALNTGDLRGATTTAGAAQNSSPNQLNSHPVDRASGSLWRKNFQPPKGRMPRMTRDHQHNPDPNENAARIVKQAIAGTSDTKR